jgi:osmotically-inducible protein OsmY
MKKVAIISSLTLMMLNLSGCVPLAVVATGEVGASIAEERSFGRIIDDATIIAKIKNEFAQKDMTNLLSRVSVSVKEGRVLLTGSVPEHKYSVQAVRAAWSVEGVKEVINELDVADKDLKVRARDSLIATKVRARLLLQKGVSSINYTVDVNHGVIYLIGIAQNQEELDLATRVASQVEGVKKVVSHVTLKNDPRRRNA